MQVDEVKIPVYKPDLSGNEKKYVDECVDSTWISSKGDYISRFETGFSQFTGIKYAASVTNGTVAIHIALLALGIGEGDEVIVPTFTYIASVNAITYTGAKPVFVDSLMDTWQVDPKEIEKKITKNTKAIIVVHLYGLSCDMDSIMALAKKHNLKVVEDCAEAIGTKYKGRHVGSFGDIATFSFFGNKTITTGEGGMVLSNNPELIDLSRRLKGQGLASGREYWHDIIGYNYRMTNICAAIGVAQLEKIDYFITQKKRLANTYINELGSADIEMQTNNSDLEHSYWMFSILVRNNSLRDGLRDHLKTEGIETRPNFFPVHTMPIYKSDEVFPVATSLAERGINLPSYPGLSDSEIKVIAGLIKNYLADKNV